ncbi:MAG: S24 family peptidase, partial [Propionibacteriaceae bacterium]|nr:S24 family peptidase [Propionibacteriaceae bacterium]
MSPGLPRGSIVAVDLWRTDPGLADGHIVAARRGDDGIVIKRWKSCEPHAVMLTSDSTDQAAYPPHVPRMAQGTRSSVRSSGRGLTSGNGRCSMWGAKERPTECSIFA